MDPNRYTFLPQDTFLAGRYKIGEPIGRGGMGAVYRGWADHLSLDVAVKETVEPTSLLKDVLKKEGKLLASLDHAAVPKVYDSFEENIKLPSINGVRLSHFLVMKYIPGKNLYELLEERNEPFEPERVLAWTDQLLKLLAYLHDEQPSPIIHRDIKPSNLKLTDGNKIVLLDFGLSKSMEEGTNFPGWTTRPYSPLEQIQQAHTDARSDLYALAATLYHLLTRVRPPSADHRYDMVTRGKRDPLEPPHIYNSRVPQHVSANLLKAMSLERERRHRTARELHDSLRGAADSYWSSNETTILDDSHQGKRPPDSEEAPPSGQKSETSPAPIRERVLAARGVVQCIAFSMMGPVLAGGSDAGEITLWDLRDGTARLLNRDSSAVSTLAFSPDGLTLACGRRGSISFWDVESQSNWRLATSCNNVSALAFSPDGALLATGGEKKAPTAIQVWEMSTQQLEDAFEADRHFLTRALCFSPDGRTLACALWSGGRWKPRNQRGQVILLKLETRQKQLRADNVRMNALAFSPDSTTLACGCVDNAIRLIDVRTGEMIRTLPGHGNPVSSVAFSPDGHTLATADVDEQARRPGEVKLWEWRTGRLRRRYESHAYGVRAVAFSPDGKFLAYASDRQVRIVQAAG